MTQEGQLRSYQGLSCVRDAASLGLVILFSGDYGNTERFCYKVNNPKGVGVCVWPAVGRGAGRGGCGCRGWGWGGSGVGHRGYWEIARTRPQSHWVILRA